MVSSSSSTLAEIEIPSEMSRGKWSLSMTYQSQETTRQRPIFVWPEYLQWSSTEHNGSAETATFSHEHSVIQSLLCDPNPYRPLDSEIAQQYVSDRVQHDRIARQWALDYAQSFPDFLTDELASDISPQLPCSWLSNIPTTVASEFLIWRESILNDAQSASSLCFKALVHEEAHLFHFAATLPLTETPLCGIA